MWIGCGIWWKMRVWDLVDDEGVDRVWDLVDDEGVGSGG